MGTATLWFGPGTAANADRDSKTAWTDVNNVLSDDTNISTNDVVDVDYSDWIRITNFGVSLPSDATIVGIQVRTYLSAEDSNYIEDSAVYLRKTIGQVGDDGAVGDDWYTTPIGFVRKIITRGAMDDDWNAGLTKADVESADFGVDISAQNTHPISAFNAYLYYVTIGITFTTEFGDSAITGTGSSVDRDGKVSWSNPTRIEADDDSLTDCTIDKSTYSDWLTATNFGFSIPEGSIIEGIIVEIQVKGVRSGAGVDEVITSAIYLLDGDDTQVGDNKTGGEGWGDIIFGDFLYYGDLDDDWNAGLTYSDINDSNFGVRISADNEGVGLTSSKADFVRINVFFSEGPPPELHYAKAAPESDEFNDSSLDGKWTEDYQAGGSSNESGTAIFITSGDLAIPNWSGIYQSVAGDFDFRMLLTDTNPDNIGNSARISLAFWIDDSHYYSMGRNQSTNYDATRQPGGSAGGSGGWSSTSNQYMRLLRVGSNVSAYSSNNGTSWTERGAVSAIGSGSGRIYINAIDNNGGGDFIAEVDWFRIEPNAVITDITLYPNIDPRWQKALAVRAEGATWYAQLTTHTEGASASDLMVKMT